MTAIYALGGLLTTLTVTAAIALIRADRTVTNFANVTGDNDD